MRGLLYCCIWLMQVSSCAYCCTTEGFQSTKSLLEHFCFGLDIEHPTLLGKQPWTKLDFKAHKKSRKKTVKTVNIFQRTNNCPKFRISCPSKAIDLEDLDIYPKVLHRTEKWWFPKKESPFPSTDFQVDTCLSSPIQAFVPSDGSNKLGTKHGLGLNTSVNIPLWIQVCTGAPPHFLDINPGGTSHPLKTTSIELRCTGFFWHHFLYGIVGHGALWATVF